MRTRHVAYYRFRAYPTREQQALLEQWQGAQRALWNAANAQRIERLNRPGYDMRRSKRFLSAFDQHFELTECRQAIDWLREVPQMLQQALLTQLDRAWKRFFSRDAGRPRFKRKGRNDWAPLGIPARECKRISRKRIRLPKLGDLRVRGHRSMVGNPARVSLTREADQWFVAVTCEVNEPVPIAPAGAPIGLDLGVTNVLADSEGRIVANPRHFASAQKRLARAQRTAARRKPKRGHPASNNYRKATRKVALLHRKVGAPTAREHTARPQSLLRNSHGTVVIEDLRVRSMSASAHGTLEQPGARVRQKAGLNRSILDVGWRELRRQLTYKCQRYGAKLIVVDPRYSSQRCTSCGGVDASSRVTQAAFVCTACGYRAHADVNAAQNILARGLGRAGATPVPVCGGLAVGRPAMQKEGRASPLGACPVLQGGVG